MNFKIRWDYIQLYDICALFMLTQTSKPITYDPDQRTAVTAVV